jgi:hypothetical protein
MLMAERLCAAQTKQGEPCRQAPLRDAGFCFWHDPEHTQEAAEARRLGGLRRRKERTLAAAYDLGGLEGVGGPRRLLEIAAMDLITLNNSVPRNRALISAVGALLELLKTGDLEERLQALEAILAPRLRAQGKHR